MRRSVVPAQITSVEDKIAGNISVSQAILFGIPVVSAFGLATLLPPHGQFVGYKYVIISLLAVLFGSLAIRIGGRIVFDWIRVLIRYAHRPRYYIHDKNSSVCRNGGYEARPSMKRKAINSTVREKEKVRLTAEDSDIIRFEQLSRMSNSFVGFEVGKKGELHVRVQESE